MNYYKTTQIHHHYIENHNENHDENYNESYNENHNEKHYDETTKNRYHQYFQIF